MTVDSASVSSDPSAPAALAVVPARYASTRLPGKPLLDRTGKPLIQHVVERVLEAKRISRVLVATDDQRIADAVAAFGGEAVMTREDHPNGTSRIAEVVSGMAGQDADIIVNVQGDEPEIEPDVIDQLVDGLAADGEAPMATLGSDFAEGEDPANPNIVKIVLDQRGRAMYFSRSLVPFDRDGVGVRPVKHPGLYAYRRGFLLEYVTLPPAPLEQAEQLEQLRALEHGYPIAVIRTQVNHHGIDTPEQYEAFVGRLEARG
ncbi:MAG: 3-deoxy-manno-octulosonate cytidylyltransferase [Phycisphaeraceae bacterium]